MRNQKPALYECDLSGLMQPALDFDPGDDLGDLPIGWTAITISTRIPNPQYETVVQAKLAATEAMLEQAGLQPDEEDAGIVEIMTDAQFAPILEAVTPFLIEDTELFVHPDYLGELIEALGLSGEVELVDAAATLNMGDVPQVGVEEELEEAEEEEEIEAESGAAAG